MGDDAGGDEAMVAQRYKKQTFASSDLESDGLPLLGGAPLAIPPVEVRLFDEVDEGMLHESTSIYFYAMMKSMEEGTLLNLPTIASVLCLSTQILMLHGFIFAFFIGPGSNPDWNDWNTTFSIPEEKGGFYASISSIIALVAAPAIIVVKLERTHELELTPCFRATMRTMIRHKPHDWQTSKLYYFWTYMYAARAFIMVMYLAFTNAVLAVSEKNVSKIILMVLVVSFLLDFDEYTYLTL